MNKLKEEEKNIINSLKDCLTLPTQIPLTQDRFDFIISELIKTDDRELMWRLCGSYPNYNYNKVIDYFIKKEIVGI